MEKKIIVQGGLSKGGYEFNVLETPSRQVYEVVQIKSFKLGRDTYWHGYIKGNEIKKKKFPIDANPRKPGPTKVVKLMQATIQKEPSNFHHLNNGIAVIAENVEYKESTKEITVTYSGTTGIHGDGICNGGHSYYSIEQFKSRIDNNLIVRVEFIVLDPMLDSERRAEKIKIIAEARNSHNELESITTAHYSGYYDELIDTMGSNSIFFKWYEGDPNAIKGAEKVDSLISKLTAISPHWYSHYLNPVGNTGNHLSSARSTGTVHKAWQTYALNSEDERNLKYLLPLVHDLLKLKDTISRSLLSDNYPKVAKVWRRTRLWQYLTDKEPVILFFLEGDDLGVKVSHTFVTMILGAFRENVWYSVGDSGINLVGWLIDPIKLWNDHRELFMRDLNNIASTISAPSFGNAFLQNPAIYNYQFAQYEFGAKIRTAITKPEVVYDVSLGDKFVRNPNGKYALSWEEFEEDMPLCVELISAEDVNEEDIFIYEKVN